MRDRRGSYGRMIAKVYRGVRMLNEEPPRAGNAEVCTRFCNISEFGSEGWATKYGC